jgi:hypothetical protein
VFVDGNKKGLSESFMTLNFDFPWEQEDKRDDESPQTLSLSEGFEMQDTVGGSEQGNGMGMMKNLVVKRAVEEVEFGDSDSDSEQEGASVARAHARLVGDRWDMGC